MCFETSGFNLAYLLTPQLRRVPIIINNRGVTSQLEIIFSKTMFQFVKPQINVYLRDSSCNIYSELCGGSTLQLNRKPFFSRNTCTRETEFVFCICSGIPWNVWPVVYTTLHTELIDRENAFPR